MKHKRLWTGIAAFLGMLILILDGKTALQGAQQGIVLCMETVIPSLFPFFFLSAFITDICYGNSIKLLKPLGKVCAIPDGGESILLVGFLGGYPVGAQAVSNLWRSGVLSKDASERLLGFCSNAGPGFLFGMASSLFSDGWAPWCLWGIHILSAMAVASLLPASSPVYVHIPDKKNTGLILALNQSLRVMGAVCGWIILFRILIAFGDRWFFWVFPTPVRIILIGILELTNGCCTLSVIDSEALRFVICSGILALGGCCVTMQTMSVAAGLSMKYYGVGKVLQTIFSLLLSTGIMYRQWLPVLFLAVVLLIGFRKKQFYSSNLEAVGV